MWQAGDCAVELPEMQHNACISSHECNAYLHHLKRRQELSNVQTTHTIDLAAILKSGHHETYLLEHTLSLPCCLYVSCSPTPVFIVKRLLDGFLGQQQAHMSIRRLSYQLFFSHLGSRSRSVGLRDHATLSCYSVAFAQSALICWYADSGAHDL